MATGFLLFPVGYAPLNDGAVVPGGKLHFSRTGTATAKDSYSDSAVSSANANPVVLNAEGYLDTKIYGSSVDGFNYRIRLTDANDVEIWSVDDVTGDVDDTRLSANIALLDASNQFTGIIQYVLAGGAAQAEYRVSGNAGGTSAGLGLIDDGTSGFLYERSNRPLEIGTNNTARVVISAAGNFDFKAGTVTTSNLSASEVGFRGSPVNEQNGDYTLVLTDAGKTIYKASGGAGETVTIPANASVAFPIGTEVEIANNGGGNLSVAITSDTLLHTAGSGTRTLATSGVAKITKVAATVWLMNGSGIT